MGLSACLRKIGLSEHESAIIKGMAADYRSEDELSARDAAERAVMDWLEEATTERNGVVGQIESRLGALAAEREAGRQRFSKTPDVTGRDAVQEVVLRDLARAVAEKTGRSFADALREVQASIAAWHGTPHTFEAEEGAPLGRFTTKKMGTGEGAQAFGWGLYFASTRELGEFYRNKLTKTLFYNGKPVSRESGRNSLDAAAWAVHLAQGDKELAKKSGLATPEKIDLIDNGKLKPGGSLYQVQLKPNEDEWLLLDKPINEQSDQVRQLLGEIPKSYKVNFSKKQKDGTYSVEVTVPGSRASAQAYGTTKEDATQKAVDSLYKNSKSLYTGRGIYARLSAEKGSDRAASEYLASIGIPGIKFLAGDSRAKGEGNYNYVVFEDQSVEIEARFSKNGQLQGLYDPRSGLTFAVLQNLSDRTAAPFLLHEAVHAQQRAEIDDRAKALVDGRESEKRPALRAFLNRVDARLRAAKAEGDPREYSAYLVELAAQEGRQNGFSAVDGKFLDWVDRTLGKPVGNLIRDLTKLLRATWMRYAGEIAAQKMAIDDLVSFARIGLEKAASGDVKTSTEAEAVNSQAETATPTAVRDATARFDPAQIERMRVPGFKSRDKLISMPIRQFLDLSTALDREEGDKRAAVSDLLKANTPFSDIPFLQIKNRGAEGAVVVGHEGRHRALGLLRLGYTHMPVVLAMQSGGSGGIRWSEQTEPRKFDYVPDADWPTRLISEDGNRTVPFPVTREQASSEYAPTASLPSGVQFSYAGERAQTADQSLLQQAKARVDAGEDAETVRQETGWFKGKDDKWRFEIDDRKAKLTEIFSDNLQTFGDAVRNIATEKRQITSGDIMSSKELFYAYPEIKSMPVIASDSVGASFSPSRSTFYIGKGTPVSDLRKLLLHEMQHAIQDIEGFSPGANPYVPQSYTSDEKLGKLAQNLSEAEFELKRTDRAKHKELRKYLRSQDVKFPAVAIMGVPSYEAVEAAEVMLSYAKEHNLTDIIEAADAYIDFAEELGVDVMTDHNNQQQNYRDYNRAFGEIEARDTANRLDLTADQRRATPPYRETMFKDGIRDEDVIVRTGLPSDAQFSVAAASPEEIRVLDEDSSWILDRGERSAILAKLRESKESLSKGALGFLTRQMLVEYIQNIPVVGALAQEFEQFARRLDSAKQEFKQKMFDAAKRWREGLAQSREGGYLMSKLIHGATLHGVDPLGPRPSDVIEFSGAEDLQEHQRWWDTTHGWLKELEQKYPDLHKVYVDVRENYRIARDERYEALLGRTARSGLGILRSIFDRVEGLSETGTTAPDAALVNRLRDLAFADPKALSAVRGTLMSVLPDLRPAPKNGKPRPTPVPLALATARANLRGDTLAAFDALHAHLLTEPDPDLQKKMFFGVLARAQRAAQEQKNPELRSFGKRLADLQQSDPTTLQALRETLETLLAKPDSLVRIVRVPTKNDPNKTQPTMRSVVQKTDPAINAARATLPPVAQPLFDEAIRRTLNGVQDHIAVVHQFYQGLMAKGPYAPLARFGAYQVYAEKDGEKLPIFAAFGSQPEQMRAATVLQQQGWKVTVGYHIDQNYADGSVGGKFVGDLFSLVDDTVSSERERAVLKDDIYQMYLHSLPDLSAAKHFIHRKGIPGFSSDALRAYAQFMNQAANSIARLRYADILSESLLGMRKAQKRLGQDPNPDMAALQARAGRVIEELDQSYEWLMNPTNATLANRLTSFGFFWYLTNISTALVNLSQTPLVTFPELAAKFDSGTKAFATLSRTIADYGKWKFSKGEARQKATRELYDRFDGDMGRMLESLEKGDRAGAISRTETVMLAEMSADPEFSEGPVSRVLDKTKEIMSWPFQKSEVANREIAAIATYTLARNDGQSHEQASDLAYNVVFRTQGDFSNANRARYFRSNVARVLFLFRSFAQLMTWRMLRDFHRSLPEWISRTPQGVPAKTRAAMLEEKREARRRMGYMLAATSLFGGATGLPIYTMAIAMANALFGHDPDDPWDAETAVNQTLQNAFGDFGRRAVMDGPVGAALGSDISPRLSLDIARLWFRKQPDNLQADQSWDWWIRQISGPVIGYGATAAKGVGDLAGGAFQDNPEQVSRGVEGLTPAPLRNLIKAIRYGIYGVNTRQGDQLVDQPGAWDLTLQAVGFTPSDIADRYEQNAAVQKYSQALQNRRKALINGIVYAMEAGDQEAVQEFWDKAREYNLKNPEYPITGNAITQSYRQRQRMHQGTVEGLYIPSVQLRRKSLAEAGY